MIPKYLKCLHPHIVYWKSPSSKYVSGHFVSFIGGTISDMFFGGEGQSSTNIGEPGPIPASF